MVELESELRTPKKGDRLFREPHDPDRGVNFSADETSRLMFIMSGYMAAGNLLIQACEEKNHDGDLLVYPILFNYRHAIELAMKWVIGTHVKYSSLQVGKDKCTDHNLLELWGLCKKIIIESGTESDDVSYVGQVIKDFHDWDEKAQAFRYPTDKKDTIIKLPDNKIDLRNVCEVMEGLVTFFKGIDGRLAAHISAFERRSNC